MCTVDLLPVCLLGCASVCVVWREYNVVLGRELFIRSRSSSLVEKPVKSDELRWVIDTDTSHTSADLSAAVLHERGRRRAFS